MNILKALRQIFKPLMPSYQIIPNQGKTRTKDARALVKQYKSWVYVCASRNAQTCAGMRLGLYSRTKTSRYSTGKVYPTQKSYIAPYKKSADDVTEITEGHPLLDLLDSVNPYMTGQELFECTWLWLELCGDAYWYLVKSPLGVPSEVYPLSAQYVQIVPDEKDYIKGYIYGTTKENEVALSPEEVIHFRYANPNDQWYGVSPLEAAFGADIILEAAQDYERNLYDTGGMPTTAIMLKERINEDEKRRLLAEWKSKWASKINSNLPAVLYGEMDIKTLSYPPKDTGLEFTLKFSREEVCAAYNVPMTLVELQDASKAGASTGNYNYMKFGIEPRLRRMEQKLTETLAALYDDKLFLAFDNPVPADKEYRLKELDTHLKTGYSTINEERAIDGLDEVEWGNEPKLPTAPLAPNDPNADPQNPNPNEDANSKSLGFNSYRSTLEEYMLKYTQAAIDKVNDAYP